MLNITILLSIILGFTSVVNAAAPHDTGAMSAHNRAHRLVRSRRSRAASPILSNRASNDECSLSMSATEAAQWSSFLGTGLLECTASASDLKEGIAMCYRLGFVDMEKGIFGGELTVWQVEGATKKDNVTASIIASASALPSATATGSSSVGKNSTRISTADGNSTDSAASSTASTSESAVEAKETGRLRRRAKKANEAISITMEIAGVQYKTGQFSLAPEEKRGRVAKGSAGQGVVLDISNIRFAARGMQLAQSFHFVGPLQHNNNARRAVDDGDAVNKDLSFNSSSISSEASSTSRASRSSSPASSADRSVSATSTATRSAPSTTGRNATAPSKPLANSILRSLAPRMQVVASQSVAGNLSKPVMLDLLEENAKAKGFATAPFGVFAILMDAEKNKNESAGVTALISDNDCAIVVNDDANSTVPQRVFSTVELKSFFSSATQTSSATSTASAVSSVVNTTSSASVTSSATITSSASASASSAPVVVSGNPSSGPNAVVLSTGRISASEAANISPEAVATTSTTSEEPQPDPTPTPSPTPTESSSSSTTSSDANATAASAEAADPSATAFQLPGRSISVLPIGLGVFGGISAVALAIVGWVTYERRKYKKQFSQRTAAMAAGRRSGYGTV